MHKYVTVCTFIIRSHCSSQGKLAPVQLGLCDSKRIKAKSTAAAGPLDNVPGLNLVANCPNGLKAVQRGGDHQGADVSRRRRTFTDVDRSVL